jgi:hypothetical protein
MYGILNIPVQAKLALDVLIPQKPFLSREMLAVRPQESSIKWDGREECERDRA